MRGRRVVAAWSASRPASRHTPDAAPRPPRPRRTTSRQPYPYTPIAHRPTSRRLSRSSGWGRCSPWPPTGPRPRARPWTGTNQGWAGGGGTGEGGTLGGPSRSWQAVRVAGGRRGAGGWRPDPAHSHASPLPTPPAHSLQRPPTPSHACPLHPTPSHSLPRHPTPTPSHSRRLPPTPARSLARPPTLSHARPTLMSPRLLVVGFCHEVRPCGRQLGDHFLPHHAPKCIGCQLGVDFGNRLFRRLFLGGVVVVDGGPVLGACVVALAVERRRVDPREEEVQQALVGGGVGVVVDLEGRAGGGGGGGGGRVARARVADPRTPHLTKLSRPSSPHAPPLAHSNRPPPPPPTLTHHPPPSRHPPPATLIHHPPPSPAATSHHPPPPTITHQPLPAPSPARPRRAP